VGWWRFWRQAEACAKTRERVSPPKERAVEEGQVEVSCRAKWGGEGSGSLAGSGRHGGGGYETGVSQAQN